MNKEQASKELSVMLANIKADVVECEKFAIEHGLSFATPGPHDGYASSYQYFGNKDAYKEYLVESGHDDESVEYIINHVGTVPGWRSSSEWE